MVPSGHLKKWNNFNSVEQMELLLTGTGGLWKGEIDCKFIMDKKACTYIRLLLLLAFI